MSWVVDRASGREVPLSVVDDQGEQREDEAADSGGDANPAVGLDAGSEEEARAERASRLFALAGAIWTTTFALGFVWETSAAIAGRDAFVRRFEVGGAARVLFELALVFLGGLAWLGLAMRLGSDAPSVRGYRRLQWVAGLLALGFAFGHAWRFWLPAALGADGGTVYELLRRASPRYPSVALYAVGLAALGLAWEQSLLLLVGTWRFVRRPQTMRWYRLATVVLPAAMFVVGINAAGHFVTGRGLFWRSEHLGSDVPTGAPGAGEGEAADAEARGPSSTEESRP